MNSKFKRLERVKELISSFTLSTFSFTQQPIIIMTERTNKTLITPYCELPRRMQAVEASFSLAWRKEKKKRPQWLIQELKGYL